MQSHTGLHHILQKSSSMGICCSSLVSDSCRPFSDHAGSHRSICDDGNSHPSDLSTYDLCLRIDCFDTEGFTSDRLQPHRDHSHSVSGDESSYHSTIGEEYSRLTETSQSQQVQYEDPTTTEHTSFRTLMDDNKNNHDFIYRF